MERIPTVPLHEQEYWESWNENLGLPSGTIYSSKSYKEYQNTQWNKEKVIRRADNISIATGRVAGRFIQNGSKRT